MTTRISRGALACALLSTTFLAAPALAQGIAQPAYRNLDANGVDLVRGDYILSFTEGAIGSGDAALTLERRVGAINGPSQWDAIRFQKTAPYPGGTETATVTIGAVSESFTGSYPDLSPALANGASLAPASDGGYLYRASDGSTIHFSDPTGNPHAGATSFCKGYGQAICELVPVAITAPDGTAVTLEWATHERCADTYNPDGTLDCDYDHRLAGVANGFGYAIAFAYANNSPPPGGHPAADWYRRSGASFVNSAIGPAAQASVAYATPASGVTEVTDIGGRVWRVTPGAIRRPGASSDTIAVTGTVGGSLSVTHDGVTTLYARTVSGSTATMTVTNGLNQQSVVTSDLTIGRPTAVTDPLGRTTGFQYDGHGRLTRVTRPEGDQTRYSHDGRGNIVEVRSVAKPGSGLADIVTSASFVASCANPVTCNRPVSTTDARGFVTDYAYDATHGGLVSVTLPAPSAGAVRPQTRYGYTLLNGEHRLTATSACQALASCVGTVDEVKTVIGHDGSGNVVSVATGAGNGSLTATQAMSYDAMGDLLTVDGPLAGAADMVRYRYDAARELVGTVSPDPDGSGPLKHRAVRNSYLNGLLTKVEQGTVADQGDAAWAAFSPLEAVETGYDAHARPVTTKLTGGGATQALSQTSYDALGRPECGAVRMNPAAFTSLPASACTLGAQGAFGPDRISKTIYDAAGQVTQQRVALGTADEAAEVTTSYTANGQIQFLTDAEANVTEYGYDGHGRPGWTRYPAAAKGAGQSNWADWEGFSYDAAGNLVSHRLRDGQTIGYGYDALGRLTAKDLPGTVVHEYDVAYAYDNLGRLTQAADPHYAIAFGYDALGHRTSEGGPRFGTRTSQYDLAGRRTRLTWGDGFFVSYDHLVTGETKSIVEGGSGLVLASFGYDDLGRRTSLTRGNGTVTSYGYDPVSRLASLTQDLAGTVSDLSLTFAYNPAAQIATNTRSNDAYSWTGHGSGSTASSSNGLNQLTSVGGVGVAHDARGNTVHDGTRTFGYTAQNLLATGPGVDFAYDALGRLFYLS